MSPCKRLRNVAIAICVVNDHTIQDPGFFHVWQNQNVWEPTIGILLNAPLGALARVCLTISYVDYNDPRTFAEFSQTLQRLNWALLDQVVDRHPHLETLEIHLPEDISWSDDVQRTINNQLSSSVRQVARDTRVAVYRGGTGFGH